mmetsp:Transcript_51607/g.122806  ORF Transcript_51607/g.122806 Transcript_51607/m.122806 type:complete len:594 (+) Transcript_51607:118-1899(+)
MPRAQAQRIGSKDADSRYNVDDEDEGLVEGGKVELAKERATRSSELDKSSGPSMKYIGVGLAATFLLGAALWVSIASRPALMTGSMKVVTWNIAAINNNPFEYWITHDDPEYNEMMQDVEAFLSDPGDADVPLSQVFKKEWVDELVKLMKNEGWPEVEAAQKEFNDKYMTKKIANGFLKDDQIGLKRLVSMPDRMTNTVNLDDGGKSCRPAVDNCYPKKFEDLGDWWKQWKQFMFTDKMTTGGAEKRGADLIAPISHAKYPILTEAEEKMSKALSTLCQAAFDAITIHMLSVIGSGKHKEKWQSLRQEMCHALNDNKMDRTLEILSSPLYSNSDVIFLQEVAGAFVTAMKDSPLAEKFEVVATDSTRDQNSVILLHRRSFDLETLTDLTAEFDKLEVKGVAHGDLITVSVKGTLGSFILASFHGDTNGMQTIPVLTAMHKLVQKRKDGHELLFGLDANTYGHKKDKYQYVMDFAKKYNSFGLTSCWGDKPNPKNHTTFNARTYLQPQLNKAVRFKDLNAEDSGDKNPKDFILFSKGLWHVMRTWKDNTGDGEYKEGMVFPTLKFPSDHGMLATELALGKIESLEHSLDGTSGT